MLDWLMRSRARLGGSSEGTTTAQRVRSVGRAAEGVDPPGPPLFAEDRVVRPALFVLFRLATGPSADYYSQRFVAFERAGHGMAGWHWPALFVPAVWAFYRRLWLVGVIFALLPLAGAGAMALMAPWLDDSTALWLGCAALLTLVVPGVVGAALANALLYRRVRRRIRRAEAHAANPSQAASRVSQSEPVSPFAAIALGTFAAALWVGVGGPVLTTAYNEHAVRVKVGKAIMGVAPIKEQIEASWELFRRWPHAPIAAEIPARAGAVLFDEVAVDGATGRVKLAVGPSIPELAGKAILLAPAVDKTERVHWFCIPVGIPDRFLPKTCRTHTG